MTFHNSDPAAPAATNILAQYIADDISPAAGLAINGPGQSESRAVARSVADFVSNHADGRLIPSDWLLLMVCRALWAVGREKEARALLRTKGPEFNLSERHADAVFTESSFSLLGGHGSFVRALRPSASAWSVSGPYWILDMRVLCSFLETGLELVIWRILRAIFNQSADLWDASGGKGALGLKHLRFVTANILGIPRRSGQERRYRAELIFYCEQNMRLAAERKNWRATPSIIDLDS